MKTRCLVSVFETWQAAAILCFLASLPAGFGQIDYPIDPIIGPMVRIISPPNHACFFTPANVPIFAYVVDAETTTNVEFYANSTDLGSGMRLGVTNALPPGAMRPNIDLPYSPITRLGAIYWLVWSNAPIGEYALTAVAKERVYAPGFTNIYLTNDYLSRTSAPVNIAILPRIPPTNDISVVSIIATDPIAIVGTNSWIWPGLSNATPVWSNWPPPTPFPCTNWGPKDAIITVRRCGGESNAITVNFSVSGTASNGVDYVKLPGTVTLPAEQAYALIPIVPIDNGPPNTALKTVILTLTPSPTTTSNYIVGFPNHAEAIIIHEWPRPLPLLLADGSFHLNQAGPDGTWFTISSSPDLINWTTVCTNQVVQGSIDYADPGAQSGQQLFYQATAAASGPSQ